MKIKTIALTLAVAACSSQSGTSPGTGMNTTFNTTARQIGTVSQLANNAYLLNDFAADTSGVVATLLTATGPGLIVASPQAGPVSTFYMPATNDLIGRLALDPHAVYFSAGVRPTGGPLTFGVFSLPRTGGATPATFFTPPNGMGATSDMVLDADNVYMIFSGNFSVMGTGDGGAPTTSVAFRAYIIRVARNGGASTTLYQSPDGQDINTLFLDNGTLYWSETSDKVSQASPTNILSAPVGDTLAPTTLATLPTTANASALVVVSGTVVFASLVVSTGSTAPADGGTMFTLPNDAGTATISSGIYAIPPGGGAPVVVDATGVYPLAVNPGAFYYVGGKGVMRVAVGSNGAISSPAVAAAGKLAQVMAGDGAGGLYFVPYQTGALYKL
jgi:hypothetical protein